MFPQFCYYTFAPAMKDRHLQLLIEKASDMFKRYGIKSLTMDDIARELGMSKKTIYRFVDNKADLVKMVMLDYLETERAHMEGILKTSKNSVDEMIQIADYFFNQMREFNAYALHDLKKYYPETWNIYNDYRFNFVLTRINDNLKSGIKQGVYRTNINSDILSKIYIGGIDILLNQELFPIKNYAFVTLYKEYLNYHLRGIVSDKGLKLLEQHNLFKS
ncbi:MAG: TetR/AcrR family transcriptional regulator [Chitinophagales bacterium]|nr:TetR/AcrR family transcriptional regulator [Chitinophagales bacterium]